MINALFSLSIAFLGYTIYALVGEQLGVGANKSRPKSKPSATVKTPAKSKTASKSKKVSKPAAKRQPKKQENPISIELTDSIKNYLAQNGMTTIAKLTRELPNGKTAVQKAVDSLVKQRALSVTTVGRAKAVELKTKKS